MNADPEITFAAGGLDRTAHLRGDAAALAALVTRADARVLPLWRGKPLMGAGGDAGLLPCGHAVFSGRTPPIFLGLRGDAPCFAAVLPDWPGAPVGSQTGFLDQGFVVHPDIGPDFGFCDLRSRIGEVRAEDASLLVTARAICAWHESHGFCARCGAPSDMTMAGWQRTCPTCGTPHFPRTDPVVIMLVTDGNRLLLGRSPAWPEGMYSLLAGFMEPGETIEAAVRREVAEETGVCVGAVHYVASQPWPFPASLMIGCRARAETVAITIDPVEIADALWITREELARVFAGQHDRIRPPRRGAIAGQLMWDWLRDGRRARRGIEGEGGR